MRTMSRRSSLTVMLPPRPFACVIIFAQAALSLLGKTPPETTSIQQMSPAFGSIKVFTGSGSAKNHPYGHQHCGSGVPQQKSNDPKCKDGEKDRPTQVMRPLPIARNEIRGCR